MVAQVVTEDQYVNIVRGITLPSSVDHVDIVKGPIMITSVWKETGWETLDPFLKPGQWKWES
jgi:hypothetical protein